MLAKFDKLNVISSERTVLPIDVFFDGIEWISEKEKEKRKQFALEFKEEMIFIFSLFLIMQEHDYVQKDFIASQLKTKYMDLVRKYRIETDSGGTWYIDKFSKDIIGTTMKNSGVPYFTSDERAVLIAENEAQSTFNRKDYFDAVKRGRTRKTWIDIRDDRERETHREVGGSVIEINDYFLVGNSLLLYPHDNVSKLDVLKNLNAIHKKSPF